MAFYQKSDSPVSPLNPTQNIFLPMLARTTFSKPSTQIHYVTSVWKIGWIESRGWELCLGTKDYVLRLVRSLRISRAGFAPSLQPFPGLSLAHTIFVRTLPPVDL